MSEQLESIFECKWCHARKTATPVTTFGGLQSVPSMTEKDPNGIDQHSPGAKLDSGKPDAALLLDFGLALLEVAKVSTYGAKKYTRGGWQHVEDAQHRYTAAGLRHTIKARYEETDDESGIYHRAHAAWNALASLELMLREKKESKQ